LVSIGQTDERWKSLAKGIEYGIFQVKSFPEIGDGTIHIVRIDPAKAKLKLLLASEYGKKSRTTAQWCREFNLVSAINAGMFHKDLITNVGYLRNGSHIQNKRWNRKYKSALAFDPKRAGIPPAILVDLDKPDTIKSLSDYNAVVQNLRLVKGNGVNVWAKQDKKWSETAVGMDRDGRVLFLFCRSPLTMRDFNEVIKSLGLGVMRMMHVEGGPVASLSIRTPGFTLDLAGSYETTILADDTNKEQWPIPNIIGVQTR
jgi:uncharacterized protein YigE (DUF2233 family)